MTPLELDINLLPGLTPVTVASLILSLLTFESDNILSSIGSPHFCCYHLTGFLRASKNFWVHSK